MTRHLRRVIGIATTLLGIGPAVALAQQGTTVSGRVTTDAQAPLQGVSVSIASLGAGAYTDADGKYSFTVPAARASGQTVSLAARRIGFAPKTVNVTLSGATITQDFTLAPSATQLTGVVVTALGLEREKSQLGTAQQELSSEDINRTRSLGLMNQIEGKVSGVQITGSGQQGGSTNVIIRGQNSIAGNNQPLFIVDGSPVSNSDRGGTITNGYDFGNAINDLNPDDIESMTILKGPNAAALYGSRASNGVVVITTKRGRNSSGRARVEYSGTVTAETPSILPDFQNRYGQGAGGEFSYLDGKGGGTNDGADQSWGPGLNGQLIDQFTGKQQPWLPHPDNVENFFKTGHTISNTIAVSGGGDRAAARLSLGNDNVLGYVPNNSFRKTTALLNGSLQVSDALSTNATLQYVRNVGTNRPGVGYGNSILEQFFWFGRQIDTDVLRDWQQGGPTNGGPSNREYNWNYNYHNNPFWIQDENKITDSRDRFIGTASASYKFNDWITGTLRSGSDIYRLGIDQQFGEGFLNGTYVDPKYAGGFNFISDYSNENNTELLFTVDHSLLDKLHLTGAFGGNTRHAQFSSNQQQTKGLSVAGIYNVANAAIAPTLNQDLQRRAVNSIYGSAALTLNQWWTVEGTARNDWSSTLPKGENSYFYPSVNTSIVLTDAIPSLANGWVSYLKVRGSIARVGNDANPYQLATTYTGLSTKFGGLPLFGLGDVLANSELKPEITKSNEAGIEVGLFNNRVSLDASVYDKSTHNQIFNVTVSPTSGFTSKAINAGNISNKGIDGLLTVVPLRMNNGFQWTSTFNMSRNRSKVTELAPGVSTIVLGRGIFAEVNVEARIDQPYGTIFGSGFARDSASGKVLTHDGLPYGDPAFKILGNIQPDWIGGWDNTFTFKNVSLGVLIDMRRGGQIISSTNEVGEYSGVLQSSLRGREAEWNDPGIIVDGIDDVTGAANTTNVTAEQYFQGFFPVIEPYVYDASYTKLRELRVGFDLPQRWANRLAAQSVSLSLTGRNLYTWKKVPNIDPEFAFSTGNFQGIEYAMPSNPRTFGLSVRVTP